MIHLRRVYEKPRSGEGKRFLVERLWPRGLRKEDLSPHVWQKDAAPSGELRKWFAHDASKWVEFQRRYFAELNAEPAAWAPILEAASSGTATLLYSARDAEHNNALALKQYLEKKLAHRR